MLFFEYLPDKFKALWESWGVEFLVLLNFLFQSFLTFYGGSRKYNYKYRVRVLVWLSYLLSSKFATIILGKLTIIPIDGGRRHTHSELLALLAPWILMQIGSPDGITAFAIEDVELGVRQILNLNIQFFMVMYIIIRSWTSSLTSYLYLPMYLAGIIKYGETAWALKSGLDCSRQTILYFYQKAGLPGLMDKFSKVRQDTPYAGDAKLILIAYCRFFLLRPHLENWPFQALFKSEDDKISIAGLNSEKIFRVAETELGFMYDVLYTKAAIVYTKTGCILRIISFFSLTGTLYGFTALFDDAFVYHIGVGFVYFVLAASAILETYQILLLPFSDWAIVMMIKHLKGSLRETFLKILAPQSKRWRKWSNTVEQFNLLDFCVDGWWARISRWKIFQYFGVDMKLRNLWNTTRISINSEVKELIWSEMKNIDEKRKQRPFVEVGQWTMDTYGIKDGDLIKKIFGKSFEKCIITWHVATDICYYKYLRLAHGDEDSFKTKRIKAMITISNYMMFFLARRPHVLGTTTTVVLLDHIMNYAIGAVRPVGAREQILELLEKTTEISMSGRPTEVQIEWERERFFHKTPVTEGWFLLKDVKDLVQVLESWENFQIWEIIGRAWIEMMCYAASNSEIKDHAKHLEQGGELITLVWLLLAHNTNKYQTDNPSADPTSAV